MFYLGHLSPQELKNNQRDTFDGVEHDLLIKTLKRREVHDKDVQLITTCNIYREQIAYMKKDEEHEYAIRIKGGVRQGCILSLLLFNTHVDDVFRNVSQNYGIMAYGNRRINKMSYADGTVLPAESESDLKKIVE